MTSARFDVLLATLEEQVASSRAHAQKMRYALEESGSWALAEDRDWIADAVTEFEQMCADAEARLAAGRRIVERCVGVSRAADSQSTPQE